MLHKEMFVFLNYYDASVTNSSDSLKSKEMHHIAAKATIV